MNYIIKNTLNILQSPSLNESRLSSIIRKINKEDVSTIVIFSPYRKDNTDEINNNNYEQLKKDISENEWGYLQLEGGWKENSGSVNESLVQEKSVFIEVHKTEEDKLWKFCINNCQVYNQDGFIFQSHKKPFGVYSKRGHTVFLFKRKQIHGKHKINKINFNDVEEMYSMLRFGSDSGKKFIFESITEKTCYIMLESMIRRNWLDN